MPIPPKARMRLIIDRLLYASCRRIISSFIAQTSRQTPPENVSCRAFNRCHNAKFQGGLMKIALGLLLAVSMLAAQTSNDTPEAHVAIAKAAAGEDYQNLFNFLCTVPGPRGGGGGARAGAPRGQGGGQRQGPPDRSTWHAEPVKVFDNLYFVGQTEYSVWAITTSAGIILIDAIFDYSVDDEVVGGLKKLGLDPANIKYVIVSHGHSDHSGGAKYLQDTFK